ncbi:uncharacterized [Tachysurus ichikawai]
MSDSLPEDRIKGEDAHLKLITQAAGISAHRAPTDRSRDLTLLQLVFKLSRQNEEALGQKVSSETSLTPKPYSKPDSKLNLNLTLKPYSKPDSKALL